MKKLSKALISVLAISVITIPTLANSISLRIDNQLIVPAVAPYESEGTVLVPLRIVSEELGAKVDWNQKDQVITIIQADTTIVLTVGSKTAKVNGVAKELLLAPQVNNNTTMLPIRFVSENLNCNVNWDKVSQTVSVNAKDIPYEESKGEKVTTFKNPKVINGVVYLTKEQMVEAFGVSIDKVESHTVTITRKDFHCWLSRIPLKEWKHTGMNNRVNWAYLPRSQKEDDIAVTENNIIYYPVKFLTQYLNSSLVYNEVTKELTITNNGILIHEKTEEQYRVVEGYVYLPNGEPAVGIKVGLHLEGVPLHQTEGDVTDKNGYYNIGKLDTKKYPYFKIDAYGYDGEHSDINYHGRVANPALKDYYGGLGKYLTDSSQSEIKDHANAKCWSNVKTIPNIYVYRKNSSDN